MKKTLGIIIGRFNPVHIGHINIFKKSIENNFFTIIFIGSANIINEINPFSAIEREEMINKCLSKFDNYKITHLNDYNSDLEWIEKIITEIKNSGLEIKDINIYFGDEKNDYAIKVIKENISKFDMNLKFIEINRQNFSKNIGIEVSSTNLRNAIKSKDINVLKILIPEEILNKFIEKGKKLT